MQARLFSRASPSLGYDVTVGGEKLITPTALKWRDLEAHVSSRSRMVAAGRFFSLIGNLRAVGGHHGFDGQQTSFSRRKVKTVRDDPGIAIAQEKVPCLPVFTNQEGHRVGIQNTSGALHEPSIEVTALRTCYEPLCQFPIGYCVRPWSADALRLHRELLLPRELAHVGRADSLGSRKALIRPSMPYG